MLHIRLPGFTIKILYGAVFIFFLAFTFTLPVSVQASKYRNYINTQHPVGTVVKASGPCFNNSDRYVDCGNGTVTDTVTGLIWLKKADCLEATDWATANYKAAEIKSGDCNLSDNSSSGDWRLPTKDEVTAILPPSTLNCTTPTLVDQEGTGCFAAGTQWATDIQFNYWSSTTGPYQEAGNSAWAIFLNFGGVVNTSKPSLVYGWPVRGTP
ncbi:DUF1566 domain-containing protein [Nostoc sp. UCD121]|uniref:Lcl C-terminal domain-containing protein n=1 Tax=unclassified Nostoc TaxID=2593658 RepID=UPI0016281D62|nr:MULTISPECIES: DUF1566 domain-containing protein [unclassified Nostoc]MBC1223516.1 DUF1566 domain-containing protein [Nostoc sp. UCD120]MBC1277842.1 DUF1566 domain-containing protein [Nostoc sp. UCD121]